MKKIVALVLSLVMALSLCTVAFAEVKDVVYAAEDGKVDEDIALFTNFDTVKAHANKNGSGNVKYYVAGDVEVPVIKYKVVWDEYAPTLGYDTWAEAKAYLDTYPADSGHVEAYDSGETELETIYLIPCPEDDATCALYKNGKFNTWLRATNDESLAYYDLTGKAQAATTAKPNCTTDQFFEDGYIGADDCFYIAVDVETTDFEKVMNVDGKIVFVVEVCEDPDYVIWASHIFAKGVKNDKTGYDVCTCLVCKGEFACTNSTEVATKNGYKISTGFEYKTDYATLVYDENKYENGYDFAWGQDYAEDYAYVWQLKAGTTEEIGTATETETKTEGVESAKTFDAGIAMYVGMSLMSVAGTAVVIGKKKEF